MRVACPKCGAVRGALGSGRGLGCRGQGAGGRGVTEQGGGGGMAGPKQRARVQLGILTAVRRGQSLPQLRDGACAAEDVCRVTHRALSGEAHV